MRKLVFPPSEMGRAVSKKVLIDFEVVAVGNASHRENMLDTQKSKQLITTSKCQPPFAICVFV